MGDVILYKEDVDRLNFLLKNLIGDAKILSALLITKDTRVLACQGALSSSDPGALAALLVGSFAATQAIATLIGETEFDTMSHLGKSRNVVISLVNEETILVSIFDKNSSSEIITQVGSRYTDLFKKALSAIGGNTANGLFDGLETASADGDDDFDKRTDALVRSMETEHSAPLSQPPPSGQRQPMHGNDAKHSHDNGHEMAEVSRQKKAPMNPAMAEIKRPPDTQVLVSEPALTSKDYEVYSLNESSVSPPPQRPATPIREKKPVSSPETGKGETVFSSMNYLKTKAREGALYYHHDKAFLKKFFKTSIKKKP